MVILHFWRPPKECICSPLPRHLPLLFICLLLCHHLCSFPSTCFPTSSASSSGLLHHFSSSTAFSPPSTYSSPSLPLCAPFLPTHQSLALASPLRTYGMMDWRASGASKAKGHLLGALRCRGALGPAMQPRPHTSVSRHSHNMQGGAQQHLL